MKRTVYALQAAGLISGGILISVAARRPWLAWGLSVEAGTDMVTGKSAFALGLVAIALSVALSGVRNRPAGAIATMIGAWLSVTVIMLTVSAFRLERTIYTIDEGFEGQVRLVSQDTLSGLFWTMSGGAILGAASLIGFARGLWGSDRWVSLSDMARGERRALKAQVAALFFGGVLIAAAATLRWTTPAFFSPGVLGVNFGEGGIVLGLGGVAALFGALRFAIRTKAMLNAVTVLGAWLSMAVIMLAASALWDIDSQGRPAAYGLYLVVAGSAITFAGSLLGLTAAPSERTPSPQAPTEADVTSPA